MRNILIVIQVAVVIFLARLCSSNTASTAGNHSENDLKVQIMSGRKNREPLPTFVSKKPSTENNKELIEFLRETADARLMDFEEGRIAKERGSSKEIKEYGELMVRDQVKMLNEIKSIAAHRNIALDQKVSDKRLEGLNDIKNLKGRHFDKKFVRMMKIDHRRDIRQLKKAIKSDDPEIKRIGNKYLPIVKTHLDKLKQL